MDKQYIETVNHLKKKLDKGVSFEKTMHILYKLQKIPISIKLLEATGIGLKIRELSKAEKNNDIGKTAKLLTMAWKDFVRNQPADDNDNSDDNEEERNHQNRSPKEEEASEQEELSQDSVESSPHRNHLRHSKHSKKSSHHRDRDHHSHHHKENGHRTYKNSDSEGEEEESSPPESSKHKEKKKHKHHHKEKKRHHKIHKSSRASDDSQEEEEEEEIDSTDEAAAELFGAAISRKEQKRAEKKHRRREEKEKRRDHQRELNMEKSSSSVKRLRIKEPVDPNDPNYRPSMHRRLDEMIAEGASARARAPPPPPPPSSSQLIHQNAAEADAHERANTAGMKLFRGRTAVWSGASKVVTVAKVYPLQELCIRLLMNHLDMIFEVGDLPYYILKPVLEKCSVHQLRRIEYYNPQLCDESDELWNEFVQKEFKTPLKPSRFGSWREYYDYQVDARERRLKAITAGISSKARKAVPERKTVTIDVKLPREIRRRQERASNPFYSSGGGSSSNSQRTSNYSSSSGLGGTAPHSMGPGGGMVTLGANKPKTAPLMKKLLQIRKGKGGFKR